MNQYHELKGGNQVLFTVGHIGPGMLNQFITTWLLVFLAGGSSLLLNASLVGICLMSGRLVDAIADPLVANWSDRLHNAKYGRRLPFMVLGTLPMAIAFNMLWYTGLFENPWLRFAWVLVAVNLFYFSYTVVVNPYFALLPEIAKDKKQRMFIQSFVALFGILGMGVAMGASGFLIEMLGFEGAGLALSIICILTMAGPALTVRVKSSTAPAPLNTSSSNVFVSLKSALSNKTFATYITGFSIFYLGFQLVQYNLAFLTTVLLGQQKSMASTLFIVSVVVGILFIPVYNFLLKRISCSSALKLAIFAYVIVAILIVFIPFFVSLGIDGRIIGFVLMALLGFPYSGLMVIPNVIISEIIDEDIRVNNLHREALFFGVQGLINKFMVSIAALVVGLLLDIFGNTAENPWGIIAVAPVAAVVSLAGFFIIQKLHISHEPQQNK